MDIIEIMEEVKDILGEGTHLDYPGYLHVQDHKGRHHNVGFQEQKWVFEIYQDEDEYYDGSEPDHVGDLDIPQGTTDPNTIAQAIRKHLEQ